MLYPLGEEQPALAILQRLESLQGVLHPLGVEQPVLAVRPQAGKPTGRCCTLWGMNIQRWLFLNRLGSLKGGGATTFPTVPSLGGTLCTIKRDPWRSLPGHSQCWLFLREPMPLWDPQEDLMGNSQCWPCPSRRNSQCWLFLQELGGLQRVLYPWKRNRQHWLFLRGHGSVSACPMVCRGCCTPSEGTASAGQG